jgi:hypothetical protein
MSVFKSCSIDGLQQYKSVFDLIKVLGCYGLKDEN